MLLGVTTWPLLVIWLGARAAPGDRVATIVSTAGTGVILLVGGHLARRRWLADSLLAVVGAAAVVVAVLSAAGPGGITDPFQGPIDYGNARAAMYVLGAGALLALGVRARPRVARATLVVAAVGLLTLPWLLGTRAAAVGTVIVAVGALASSHLRGRRIALFLAPVIAGGTLVGTVALAVAHETGVGTTVVDVASSGLTERRLELWGDALAITRAHPLNGVGLGRFAQESPTARSDRDAGWAHHEPLQLAAEAGLPALILALALAAWAGTGLLIGDRGPELSVQLLTLAAVAAHACTDYILHEPLVLGGFVLLAAAHEHGRSESPQQLHSVSRIGP